MKLASQVLLTAALFFMISGAAKAAENIEIPNDGIKVYSKSDIGSPVVGILKKGSVVPAATNPVGNFRKVMITVAGQKKIGYINLYDVKGPLKVVQPQQLIATGKAPGANGAPAPGTPQKMQQPAAPSTPQKMNQQTPPATAGTQAPGKTAQNRPVQQLQPLPVPTVRHVVKRSAYIGLHNRTAFGLITGIAYQYQGARTYTDNTGASSNVGALTGSMLQYGLVMNFPLGFNSALDPYVMYKPITVTGSATPATGGAVSAIVLQQNYVSAGALLKFYPSSYGSFWYGFGGQVDHATSGSLQIGNNTPIASQQGDLPNLIMVYGALGVNFGLSKSIFLIPELRAGALVNTTPFIYELSGDVNIEFAF